MIQLDEYYRVHPRLGNQLFMYAYAAYLRRRWGCQIYEYHCTGIEINLPQPEFTANGAAVPSISDHDALFYLCNPVSSATLSGYFQMPELLHRSDYGCHLRSLYRYNPVAVDEKHVFVHVRAGDVSDSRMLPKSYYRSMLSSFSFSGGYVASDSPEHETVKHICEEYGLEAYTDTPERTLLFGASHSRVVLSLGSFSFWIGLLCNGTVHSITGDDAHRTYECQRWHPSYNLQIIKLLQPDAHET